MVPPKGKLGERELALLAIARRPELEALRGAVAVASAQHLAAGDLENPELRFSYAYDNDDRIGEPYTERETVLTDSTESYRSTSSTAGAGELVADRESGREHTSRFREIERRVTPGATKDVVEERVYETARSRSAGTRARTETDAKGTASRVDGRRESESRRLVSSTRRLGCAGALPAAASLGAKGAHPARRRRGEPRGGRVSRCRGPGGAHGARRVS
jgi:hypothetical protein